MSFPSGYNKFISYSKMIVYNVFSWRIMTTSRQDTQSSQNKERHHASNQRHPHFPRLLWHCHPWYLRSFPHC
ncbi:hypothetical protein PMW_50 [Pseudomonas phage phiPMW]|uniref:Uncharacterized protein n=1 Tax=Pseudomonas phage phiPMW TaxID=1815582 RepID=A0A1S5R186_9CAUD|nr:hypothetical protein FDG97_gp050 [Pseudomonas phage phiPMW]ANA49175.1 hypothetical protein PMW_50 [Pseudomonas phage phiPMW]